ncbi:hypothetical protein ABFS82_11G046700 [Erythranthe guttata]
MTLLPNKLTVFHPTSIKEFFYRLSFRIKFDLVKWRCSKPNSTKKTNFALISVNFGERIGDGRRIYGSTPENHTFNNIDQIHREKFHIIGDIKEFKENNPDQKLHPNIAINLPLNLIKFTDKEIQNTQMEIWNYRTQHTNQKTPPHHHKQEQAPPRNHTPE